jgi:hypothetical protein
VQIRQSKACLTGVQSPSCIICLSLFESIVRDVPAGKDEGIATFAKRGDESFCRDCEFYLAEVVGARRSWETEAMIGTRKLRKVARNRLFRGEVVRSTKYFYQFSIAVEADNVIYTYLSKGYCADENHCK